MADGLTAVYAALIHAEIVSGIEEIVSSIDMSDPQNGNPPVSPAARTPRTWDFMETTFVALVAYAVFGLTGGLGVEIILQMQDGVEKLPPAQFQELKQDKKDCGNGVWLLKGHENPESAG